MENKPVDQANVITECNYLSAQSEKVAQYNGWVILSFELQEYFAQLGEFIRAHEEMKSILLQHYRDKPIIMERAQQLPDIEYRDYNRDMPSGQNALLLLTLYLFFPLAYFWIRKRVRYIDTTRDKLFQSHGLYSSIAFLLEKGLAEEKGR